MMCGIMTWEQIKKTYPSQMVGLVDVEMYENSSVVKRGFVKYTSKDTCSKEMSLMAMKGEIILRYTTLDEEEIGGII